MNDEVRATLLIEQMNQHRDEHGLLVGGMKKNIYVLADELVRVRGECEMKSYHIAFLEAALAHARKPWWRRWLDKRKAAKEFRS